MVYYNSSFVWLLEPTLFLWIPGTLMISGAFASIRFHSFLSFFEYVPFPILVNNCIIMLTVTMVPSTTILAESSALLIRIRQLVTRKARVKVLKKEVESLREFGVRLGFTRTVKKKAILTSYYFISNYIFTVLIAFPEVTH